MVHSAEVVMEARKWIGVRWQHQGRTKRGVDCAGLVVCVARSLALLEGDFDKTDYPRRPTAYGFMKPFDTHMDKVDIVSARPGDVMLFSDNGFPCHSAILGSLYEELSIIHAYATRRKVVEDVLSQGDWMSKRVAAYRFKGIV